MLWGGAELPLGVVEVCHLLWGRCQLHEGTLLLLSDISIHRTPLPTTKPQTSTKGGRIVTPSPSSAPPPGSGMDFPMGSNESPPEAQPLPGDEPWVPLGSSVEWSCRGIGEQLSCAQPHPSPRARRAEGDALKIAGGIFDPEN